MFLHNLIFSHARARPSAVAIIEADRGGNRVTYAELAGRVKDMARELSDRGFGKGDRLGILSKNSIGFVEAFFAASCAGGIAVPLNYTLPALEIIGITRHAGISILYTEKGIEEKNVSGIGKTGIAAIIYTSGTTAKPMGVMLSHKNLVSNAGSIAAYTHLKPADSMLCTLPFYYIYGLSLLLSHFFAGGTIVLDNRFMYPARVLDSIERFKTTGFAGVSSHYSILLDRTDFKKRRLASLMYFMQAGDKMPPALARELRNAFPRKKIYLMYGQTEASPRLSYLDPCLVKTKPGSVGKAVPGVRIKVVDESGRECAAGEEGEIIAHGNNIMSGYWKNRRQTKKVLRNGWLHTGDIAYKDRDGDLFLIGRKKGFIKVGGRKVNPDKVAGVILAHPDILETAVVGVPDRLTGSRIRAFVVPRKGRKIKKSDIIRLCKIDLPTYGVPSDIAIVTSIPRNALGKIDRERLVGLR
ncbi:MAG: class I adenylate-forming enzyme family protein [Candidatus Omnitrophota bacterium]|jgi:acyl-CoA synthetase (AMP-forming)/AMP-acid ligase II